MIIMILIILVLAVAGLFVWKYAVRDQSVPSHPVEGGVTKKIDPKAPKEIKSKEIEEFTAHLKEENIGNPTLLYQGHASLRIVTAEGKVIYIDPFAGEGYDIAADLILQTHGHFDHGDMDKIAKRNDDCKVITHNESIVNGEHKTFNLGYVSVEAVEAGYNKNHDKKNCVGYILTFSNGVTLYVSGDTSKTEQMAELADRNLDYAFYCCDGVYNMDVKEAVECANLVGAKVNIPYHSGSASVTAFDDDNANAFNAKGALIVKPGEELELK